MLLAIDVGNTSIVLGVFNGDKLVYDWRLATDSNRTADEYGMRIHQLLSYEGLELGDIDDVIISTVVPPLLYTLQHTAQKYFKKKAIVVSPGIKTGLIVKYDNPKQLGSDRIVNAVGAYARYGGPLIIVDMGTATKFCAVTSKGEYLGGTIAPGVKISSEALVEKTAKLPKIELAAPGHVICRNTIQSMQSGVIYGHMGMVAFVIDKMKAELSKYEESDKPVKVVATGGMATTISGGVPAIDVIDRMLTLHGLKLIYEKNKK